MILGVPNWRVFELNQSANLERRLAQAPLVAVSGVLQHDVNAPRFQAILDTVLASSMSGVPHLIMLDDTSHPDAAQKLIEVGAAVVVVNHETEGGLARPYVIAAQLLDAFAPHALMVKFEGEKPLFEGGRNIDTLLEVGRMFDITTGERTRPTWESMPPYQVTTELWLGYVIGQLLNISHDTPSGVMALNGAGRKVFIENVIENSWPYLFTIPQIGVESGCRVGSVPVDFRYHSAVVQEETGNPVFDAKRRAQLDVMLDAALQRVHPLMDDQVLALAEQLRLFRVSLEQDAK